MNQQTLTSERWQSNLKVSEPQRNLWPLNSFRQNKVTQGATGYNFTYRWRSPADVRDQQTQDSQPIFTRGTSPQQRTIIRASQPKRQEASRFPSAGRPTPRLRRLEPQNAIQPADRPPAAPTNHSGPISTQPWDPPANHNALKCDTSNAALNSRLVASDLHLTTSSLQTGTSSPPWPCHERHPQSSSSRTNEPDAGYSATARY